MRKSIDMRDVDDALRSIDRGLERVMWQAINYFIILVMGAASAVAFGILSS